MPPPPRYGSLCLHVSSRLGPAGKSSPSSWLETTRLSVHGGGRAQAQTGCPQSTSLSQRLSGKRVQAWQAPRVRRGQGNSVSQQASRRRGGRADRGERDGVCASGAARACVRVCCGGWEGGRFQSSRAVRGACAAEAVEGGGRDDDDDDDDDGGGGGGGSGGGDGGGWGCSGDGARGGCCRRRRRCSRRFGPQRLPRRPSGGRAGDGTLGSMSDNDDIEVESDEEEPRFQSPADKRAHHNALERKRRDHIKDSFHSLRDSVPSLQGEKASRAQILDKATEYIQYMRRKNHTHQQDIDDLKRQNALLEQQVRALEKARSSAQLQANYSSSDNSLYTNPKGSTISAFDGGSDSSSESELEEPQCRKKLRMEAS
ncbi:hypothetical protein JRQ81_000075 [Phrynocephalus forsythii]|uniref:Protein max n=1 Tax=Phrynocephalus forsythii TaxID=171643 RepID=A0A9Q0Y4N5_9SAUR|nr:hypothetical protein JRQ81_000075 [Phrynocephalus forsythii]